MRRREGVTAGAVGGADSWGGVAGWTRAPEGGKAAATEGRCGCHGERLDVARRVAIDCIMVSLMRIAWRETVGGDDGALLKPIVRSGDQSLASGT